MKETGSLSKKES